MEWQKKLFSITEVKLASIVSIASIASIASITSIASIASLASLITILIRWSLSFQEKTMMYQKN